MEWLIDRYTEEITKHTHQAGTMGQEVIMVQNLEIVRAMAQIHHKQEKKSLVFSKEELPKLDGHHLEVDQEVGQEVVDTVNNLFLIISY